MAQADQKARIELLLNGKPIYAPKFIRYDEFIGYDELRIVLNPLSAWGPGFRIEPLASDEAAGAKTAFAIERNLVPEPEIKWVVLTSSQSDDYCRQVVERNLKHPSFARSPACECGSEKVGSPRHSGWCPRWAP